MVTDSAANQLLANRELEIPFIKCCAHQIQLCIHDAFKDCVIVDEAVKKSQRIIKYFKKSNAAMNILIQVLNFIIFISLIMNFYDNWIY